MLTESLLIGVAGGALGLLMSEWGINLLRVGLSFNFYGRQMAAGIHLDMPTLLFTAMTALVTALLFGLVPAMRASGADLAGTLNDGGRSGSVGHGRSRMRSALVATEIALAVTLLAGTGVMMREFIREFTQNEGFNPNHVLTAGIHLVSRNYQQNQGPRLAFFEHVTETLRHLPGVESASMTSAVPLEGSRNTSFSIDGEAQLPGSSRPLADYFLVGPRYFHTMEIPLLEGRDFLDSEKAHSPIVAVVDQEFARRFLPKNNVVGQRVQVDSGHRAWAEIVGIVGNVNDFVGQLAPSPQIYESYLQFPVVDMSLVARSRVDPVALAPLLRRAVWSVDKDQPIGDLREGVLTMNDIANQNAGGDKLMVSLLGIFAGLALILAAVGLYGVIAYSVKQRTHEIGIRMPLGAREGDVLGLVLRQGAFLTAVGCGTGLVLALPLPKLFAGLFNGMAPQGGLVAIVAGVIGAAVSLFACYIPARRATKIDPMVALRYE
jgi:putative ABC transport system permease protein